MTKNDVQECIKRYLKVKKMVKEKIEELPYYVGKRKKKIRLTETIREIYETIEEVYSQIKEDWLKRLIDGILKGKSDVYLMQKYPCGRNLYYAIKREFVETVYRCCIAKQMVAYEDLLEMGVTK